MTLAPMATQLAVTGGRPVEIVAVDAFTIYRGLDIATATPTAADRAVVAHHLLDVLDPCETVTVAQFQQWARQAITQIHDRDHVPLLVGGSGLYFRAVVDPLEFPPTDASVRAALEQRWQHDPAAAHTFLQSLDPEAAALIEPDNLRRTIRALEVAELTGRLFSSYRTAWDDYTSIYNLAVDYLEPATRDLRQRIDQRSMTMIAEGVVDEVAALDLDRLSTTARQGIGVAEVLAVADGSAPMEGLADAIATRTWHYARRQRSWFRRDPRCAARTHTSVTELVADMADRTMPSRT